MEKIKELKQQNKHLNDLLDNALNNNEKLEEKIKELCNEASKSNWKCMELVYEILDIFESEE